MIFFLNKLTGLNLSSKSEWKFFKVDNPFFSLFQVSNYLVSNLDVSCSICSIRSTFDFYNLKIFGILRFVFKGI